MSAAVHGMWRAGVNGAEVRCLGDLHSRKGTYRSQLDCGDGQGGSEFSG